jgi:predicted RNase H-like HicB family nuclease
MARWRKCRCTDPLLAALAMIEIVFVVDEAPEGGFTARAVGESIFTEGDTLDELRANVRSAVECHFDEGQAPKVIRLHIVRDEILAP